MPQSIILRAALASLLALPTLPSLADGPTSPPAAAPGLISLDLQNVTVRDALSAFESISLLRLRPLWLDDQHASGLDPDRQISLHCRNAPPMLALESLLRQADAAATWQLAEAGEIEIGPRSRLNEHTITRIYPVRDLLTTVPDHRDMPAIDLNAALQRAGTSPLREETPAPAASDQPKPDPAKELITLITTSVEPEQWSRQDGPASIIVFQNSLIITAPGYIHRQLQTTPP